MKTDTQAFAIGSLATRIMYSDRLAGRIIATERNGSVLVFQEDKATLLNGVNSGEKDALHFSPGGFFGHTSGSQRWKLEANPNGRIHRYSRRTLKDGTIRFVYVGESTRNGERLIAGHSHYYDFNF